MTRVPFNALGAALLAGVMSIGFSTGASSETIEGALARAYGSNPNLNANRAGTRAVDEAVPQALSGYRPRVAASADTGYASQDTLIGGNSSNDKYFPRGLGVQLDQTIWNGNRTGNSVRRADSNVLRAREQLRQTEQSVLLDAATAYMDVLRDTAILNLRQNNIDVLEEQLRQTRDRFNVGEVTRTDVAQAEARLATSNSDASLASGNLKSSLARFRQVVGADAKQLAPAKAVDAMLPKSLDIAVAASQSDHPTIFAALHDVDAAQLQVKITEGELYPTLSARGTVSQRWDYQGSNREADAIHDCRVAERSDLRGRRSLFPRSAGQGDSWAKGGWRQIKRASLSARTWFRPGGSLKPPASGSRPARQVSLPPRRR